MNLPDHPHRSPAKRATIAFVTLALLAGLAGAATEPPTPRAIPTFECVGLEWPQPLGNRSLRCDVAYRAESETAWRDGYPLEWDEVEKQYRGSVVGLAPGRRYDFKLSLADGRGTATVAQRTWPERFPIGEIETLPAGTRDSPLRITRGGAPGAYRLVRAAPGGTIIDVADRADSCVIVTASYVIVQGLELRNATVHGLVVDGAHDVVIEGCTITGWGRPEPVSDPRSKPRLGHHLDSGIFCTGPGVERIVIQGNTLSLPRYTSNYWTEWSPHFRSTHPQGPKAVLFDVPGRGNHVVRHNAFRGAPDRLFCDVLFESPGGASAPQLGNGVDRDSDIYGNIIADFTDDAMELERGARNVRVWGNFIDNGYKSFSVTLVDGPVYLFRNVTGKKFDPFRTGPGHYVPGRRLGPFMGPTFGPVGSVNAGRCRIFVFHNTLLGPEGFADAAFRANSTGSPIEAADQSLLVLNNIIVTATGANFDRPYVFRNARVAAAPAIDYCLFNGHLDRPEAGGAHNLVAIPHYARGHGPDRPGRNQLAAASPGIDAALVLPNFNDAFTGAGPDIGAHERDTPDLRYGPQLWIPSDRGR